MLRNARRLRGNADRFTTLGVGYGIEAAQTVDRESRSRPQLDVEVALDATPQGELLLSHLAIFR